MTLTCDECHARYGVCQCLLENLALLDARLRKAEAEVDQTRGALRAICCGGSSDRMIRIAEDALAFEATKASPIRSATPGEKR